MSKRIFLIVLDSFGIGYLPDAEAFGDYGANTLKTVSKSLFFDLPNLKQMGLFNIDGVVCEGDSTKPNAQIARLSELSKGKDTTTGHWEIAGVVSEKPFPVYPDGFPVSYHLPLTV